MRISDEMGQCLGKLQREVQSLQDREEDREKRTELALEAMEIMMTTKDEEAEQRLQQKTEENAQKISLVRVVSVLETCVRGSHVYRGVPSSGEVKNPSSTPVTASVCHMLKALVPQNP